MARPKVFLDGKVFGFLTVMHEGERRVTSSGEKVRVWVCSCVCGNEVTVDQKDLMRKRRCTKSCGCMRGVLRDLSMGNTNLSQTKIGAQWYSMNTRSRNRTKMGEDCQVKFRDIEHFYNYCVNNGWFDGCVICRIGDAGHYEEGNIRFDTHQSNIEEAHAQHYKLTSPDGEIVEVYNMAKFCRERGLDPRGMGNMYRGYSKTCCGWTKAVDDD